VNSARAVLTRQSIHGESEWIGCADREAKTYRVAARAGNHVRSADRDCVGLGTRGAVRYRRCGAHSPPVNRL